MGSVKMPHVAYIGPRIFSIHYGPKVVEEGEEVSGSCSGMNYKICISTTQNKTESQIKDTLFHETLHGILYITGYHDLLDSIKKEESLVVSLESFLGASINFKNSPLWGNWKMVKLGKNGDS